MPPTTSAVTFGFGFGSPSVAPHGHRSSPAAPPSVGSSSLAPKRQRSASPDDEHDDGPSTPRPIIQKRMRAKRRSPSVNVDVGKMLATLDKELLLTVFSRLLATDPALAERILPMIPTPTLSSVESALEDCQRAIRSAAVNAGDMRSEFAWGRLRTPIAEFTACALGFVPFFVAKEGSPDSLHPSVTFSWLQLVTERAQQIMAAVPATPTNLSASLFSPDANHPLVMSPTSGTPKVILKVYQDALRTENISALNPNTIVSHLIPTMLLHWAQLAECIARNVNEEGRIFGGEMVRGWLGTLEALTRQPTGEEKDEEKACRMALCAVGQRLQEQIGWLVGRHPASRASANMEF